MELIMICGVGQRIIGGEQIQMQFKNMDETFYVRSY